MAENVLIHGYEAIARGALDAGCLSFFGYPITPQTEITEFFGRELPKRGGAFVQAESESAAGAMIFGASAAGVRVMTSTSGPGWGLMQEMMSHISLCEIPVVVVNVQRGGPGQGTTRHSQTDYTTSTRGGGNGSYRSIVLAPASVQECYDLIQLAFYLADKYNILTIVLADGIVIQIAELLNLKTIDFPPLPEKDWALKSSAKKGGKFNSVLSTRGLRLPGFVPVMKEIYDKYERISKSEVRYETYQIDDADLILVAFGYVSRCCEGTVEMARAEGLKLGLIRPVTLWPFPADIIGQKASEGCRFLVVEDNMGQMIDDVKLSVEGKSRVHFLGLQSRHQPIELGMIFPETIFEEVKKIL